MPDYDSSTYGEAWADVYDAWVARHLDTPGDVDFLAELARGGRVLELGVGTGRVAIPLAERVSEVVGLDASPRMLERLRAKTDAVRAVEGEMADIPVDGPFELVFVVFNTFFALLTQDDQTRCFASVAERLADGGAFVIQAFVPDLSRFDRGQRVNATDVSADGVALDVSRHDPVTQTVDEQRIFVSESGIRLRPTRLRYAWPSELDLMARLAGLRLRERHEDFERRPFTAASASHVSVYAR